MTPTVQSLLENLAEYFDIEPNGDKVVFRRNDSREPDGEEQLVVKVSLDDGGQVWSLDKGNGRVGYEWTLKEAIKAVNKWLPAEKPEQVAAIERPRYS